MLGRDHYDSYSSGLGHLGSENDLERWLHAGRAGGSAMDGVEFFFFGIAAVGAVALTVATVTLMMVPL